MQQLVHYRRRLRWLGFALVGIISVAIAGCGPLADPSNPANKRRVSARLYVAPGDANESSFEPTACCEASSLQQLVAAAAQNPFVLNAALKKPGIWFLTIVANQTDPIAWLKSELHVEQTEAEAIELWMMVDVGHQQEVNQLVRAVAELIVDEFRKGAERKALSRLRDLEQARDTIQRELRKNAGIVQSLRDDVGVLSPERAEASNQLALTLLREIYTNERTIREEILEREIKLQQLRHQLLSPVELSDNEVRDYAERDHLLLELTRQWGELQRELFEAEIVGDDQELAKLRTLNERLSAAMQERLSAAHDAAKAALAKAKDSIEQQLQGDIAQSQESLDLYQKRLNMVLDQKKVWEENVARSGRVSRDLQRYETEGISLAEHFQRLNAEMSSIKTRLNAPARLQLLPNTKD